MQRVLVIIVFTIVANNIAAQRPHMGTWTTVQFPISISKNGQWVNDGSYRTLGVSIQPVQYFIRTGLRYIINKHWNVMTTVASFFTKTDFIKTHHEFGGEFRFSQDVNYQSQLNKKLRLLLRLRADQRFFAATSKKDKYEAYRFRLRTGINQNLSSKWSLQLTDEYLRQAANHKFLFDQNQLTFSGIYQIGKSAQLQPGLLWVKWPKENQAILTFTFIKTFSLYEN
jgi:Protein of unknown function (DUF2490)